VFVLDTNVLVYAADADSPFHAPCRHLIEEHRRRASAWYLTWNICYEFLRITTHPRVFRHPWAIANSWAFIERLMAAPGLGVLLPTERHAAVVAEVIAELPHLGGNLVHDAQTAVLMREHGLRTIYTRDTDFHRFPFLQPIDPTRG
jgi:toxin-antitoxin system PIN domain toxin